jgi:hypothetical protein
MTTNSGARPLLLHVHLTLSRPSTEWLGLVGAPFAWAVQGITGWWIASSACAVGISAGEIRLVLLVLSGSALFVAASGAVVALRGWREESIARSHGTFRIFAGIIVSAFFALGIALAVTAVTSANACESVGQGRL